MSKFADSATRSCGARRQRGRDPTALFFAARERKKRSFSGEERSGRSRPNMVPGKRARRGVKPVWSRCECPWGYSLRRFCSERAIVFCKRSGGAAHRGSLSSAGKFSRWPAGKTASCGREGDTLPPVAELRQRSRRGDVRRPGDGPGSGRSIARRIAWCDCASDIGRPGTDHRSTGRRRPSGTIRAQEQPTGSTPRCRNWKRPKPGPWQTPNSLRVLWTF